MKKDKKVEPNFLKEQETLLAEYKLYQNKKVRISLTYDKKTVDNLSNINAQNDVRVQSDITKDLL